MRKKMETIKIDEDGKYVLVVESNHSLLQTQIEEVSEVLQDWWNSEDKFYILAIGEDIRVRFERLEKDE